LIEIVAAGRIHDFPVSAIIRVRRGAIPGWRRTISLLWLNFLTRGSENAYDPHIMAERRAIYLNTQDVAEILGVTKRTLQTWLKRGSVSEPLRNPQNRYRRWTENDVRAIQAYLLQRRSGYDSVGHL
jgi:MerR HTH family regulatory protein